MKKIKVEEVVNSVRSQLNVTVNLIKQQPDIDYTSGNNPLGVVFR